MQGGGPSKLRTSGPAAPGPSDLRPKPKPFSSSPDTGSARRRRGGRAALVGGLLGQAGGAGRIAEALYAAFGGGQLPLGEGPVGDLVEPGAEVGLPVVLVVQVVGVLPQVADQQREG